MNFTEILEILKYSVNFEEFQINYNDLIPEIVKTKNNSSLEDWKYFMINKNEMKRKFYESYCKDYPEPIIRQLREAKYIYDIDIKPFIMEIEGILKPEIEFKNWLEKIK